MNFKRILRAKPFFLVLVHLSKNVICYVNISGIHVGRWLVNFAICQLSVNPVQTVHVPLWQMLSNINSELTNERRLTQNQLALSRSL